MGHVRIVLAFIGSVLVALVIAAAAHTQFVLAGLTGLGVDIPVGIRIATTARDIVGLAPSYGVIIAVGFLIAFGVAALVRRHTTTLSPVAFPIAGAVAIAASLVLMNLSFPGTPLAGARSTAGIAAQVIAGGMGGWAFSRLARRRTPAQ